MAYAIFRTAKYKTTDSIKGLMVHHLREKPEKVPGADPALSHLNVTIGASSRSALAEAVKKRLATCTRKPRPDANRVVELMATASPAFFTDKSHEEKKAYLLDCVEFAKQKFGAENVVGAYLHFDETSPNVHIICVPLETSMRTTKKLTREITALNAGHYFGGKEKMIVWQDEFAEFVQAKGHNLKRGEPKNETLRDHVPVAQYWNEQRRQINAASVAAADLLNDAAIQSQTAAELFEHAAIEANRTGFEAQTLTLQRAALDAEQATLAELRVAMQRQGAALDQEWEKLRKKTGELEGREQRLASNESLVVVKQQVLEIQNRTLKSRVEATISTLASIREKEALLRSGLKALETRQWDVVRAEEVAEMVKRPELLGMLDFLAKRKDARDMLALLKVDPSMAEMVRQNIEIAVGLGSDLQAANWGTAGNDVDWPKVARAVEPVPLPEGFDWSSSGSPSP